MVAVKHNEYPFGSIRSLLKVHVRACPAFMTSAWFSPNFFTSTYPDYLLTDPYPFPSNSQAPTALTDNQFFGSGSGLGFCVPCFGFPFPMTEGLLLIMTLD